VLQHHLRQRFDQIVTVQPSCDAGSATSFQASAAAANWNHTGIRSFCAIADGVLRYKIETAIAAPTTYTGADAKCTALSPLQ
jgi:hypothetical protein